MDKDSFYIFSTLSRSNKALTTTEISKYIFNHFNVKISKKICQNYLWSYFRDYINYNQDEYSYSLKSIKTADLDIEVYESTNEPRALTSEIYGQKILIKFDHKLTIEQLLIAIAELNFNKINSSSKKDLIKEINQRIEHNHDN